MKTLGIIGEMSPESTITYYQGINQLINQHYGKNHSALILLNSVEFEQIIDATSQAILQCKLHKIGLLIQQTGCKLLFFDTALLHIQAVADFLLSGE